MRACVWVCVGVCVGVCGCECVSSCMRGCCCVCIVCVFGLCGVPVCVRVWFGCVAFVVSSLRGMRLIACMCACFDVVVLGCVWIACSECFDVK